MQRGYALTIGMAAAVLSGCGPSHPPFATPGAMSQSSLNATHGARGTSWMAPQAKQTKRLLYASDVDSNDVRVYDYDTGREVGTLSGFSEPLDQCVDKAGDVWITNL